MTTDVSELEKLFARLISHEEQIRENARQEIQSWSFETVHALLARYWPEGYDLPRPEPISRWEHFRRKWSPSEHPPTFSAILDVIVILHASVGTNAQAVGPALSVMGRMQDRERQLHSTPSNHWPSSVMQPKGQFYFSTDVTRPVLTRPVQSRLISALSRLTPLITPQNCEISPRQCDALLIPLRHSYTDVDLTLNILTLLSWLGEKRHISTIEAVERTAISTDNGRRVRAAASACREQIHARHDKTRRAQSLLRAADHKSLSAPETLLRPVSDVSADPPDELLRSQV